MFKKLLTLSITLVFCQIYAQDIYTDVYNVFQNNCMPCHSAATSTANLDLEGNGANVSQKMADVYASLYKQNPSNSAAVANKNFLVYPGNPYRSFLYRKIDNNLTPGLSLHTGEGASEPNSQAPLDDKEIELIRQWILYGAQESGTFFDKSLLEDYYNNGGISSIDNPPAPPANGEGFQIHLGPFFLEPGGEIEYFSKYEPLLDSDIEIHKLQTVMGDFSHHYIVYQFSSTFGNVDPNLVPYGMRTGQNFDGREFVSVDQYSNTLELPEGSAFVWDQNTIFDLNSHYINYSGTEVLKCEVYYNVYTQDIGTANQEMEVILVPNTNIPIPNDNVPVTFNYDFNIATNANIYLWGLVAHTHQYGRDFNIYKNNPNGTRGEQIYDAGCAKGLPGCSFEDFDYSHLPIKYNYPFIPINIMHGVEAEATYQNDGPVSIDWGFTSDDEMMIFVAFYVTDTTGVDMEGSDDTNVSVKDLNENIDFKVYPNPSNDFVFIESINNVDFSLEIYDISGRKIYSKEKSKVSRIDVSKWNSGLYFYQLKRDGLSIANGKFAKDYNY